MSATRPHQPFSLRPLSLPLVPVGVLGVLGVPEEGQEARRALATADHDGLQDSRFGC